jgi:hypothetical protein
MSELVEYQRALSRVSFALEPSEADLALLGDVERFRMYRTMVRARLEGMARVAFRATFETVGESAFSQSFARYLHARPPASPLIRDVVASFADFAAGDVPLLATTAAHTGDLLRFEQAKWLVAYEDAPLPVVGEDGVREFDFAGVPLFNPLLRCLRLGHAVHESEPRAQSTLLLVYRPPEVEQVRWYAADPFFFGLVERCLGHDESLADSVRAACSALSLALDEPLLERLSGAVTVALERGVLLASR